MHLVMTWSGGMGGGREAPKGEDTSIYLYIYIYIYIYINNLRYADDTTLMTESKEELKNLLMKVKEESKKAGLKLNIQNTKIMASSPITSWQIDGEKSANSDRLYFMDSKITADGGCNHEIKRHSLEQKLWQT